MKALIIVALLLLSGIAIADYDEDYRRINDYQLESEIWQIDLHKGYQEDADTKEDWERHQEIIDDSYDRIRQIINNPPY